MKLNDLVARYKLFIDTSTWMSPDAYDFLGTELPKVLLEKGEHVRVPFRIVEEVNRLIESKEKEKRHKAKKAAEFLNSYFNRNLGRAYGSDNDPFADQTFLYVFQQFRVKYNLALITQDRGLAYDILNLNHQHAVQGKNIYAFRINDRGVLEEWNFNRRTTDSSRSSRTNEVPKRVPPKPTEKFKKGVKVVTQKETPIHVGKIPDVHDTVYSKVYGTLHLQQELGSGGEGKIFIANNGMVCKIYNQKRITHERYYKLKRMLEIPINETGICWPRDIITNGSNEFVGYIMEVADGKPMQTSIFQKPVLQKNFPNWTRKDLVQLAISILDKIIYLHERNIIIGDINPLNILIKEENEIFFVDTDSYQIENYPCPVGTINFTAPALQGKNFSTFLRSFDDEHFAVNTLIFMTLLPGKPPYSQQGGGTPGENIKKMEFPYPCGERSKGTAPDGPWKYIWSHLPFKIKEALYDTFTGEKRANPTELRALLVDYRQLIENDVLSDDMFPDGHKIPKDKEATLICNDSKCLKRTVKVHIDFKTKVESGSGKFICEACKWRKKQEDLMRNMGIKEDSLAEQKSFTSNQNRQTSTAQPKMNQNPNIPPKRSSNMNRQRGDSAEGTIPTPKSRVTRNQEKDITWLDKTINVLKKFQ